ncbi:MAG: hypothetical protein OXH09_11155, partial [Gammaproteobacteria bacterium]|nr:hypothetical protein [Gammaproteobacteria bacterium]
IGVVSIVERRPRAELQKIQTVCLLEYVFMRFLFGGIFEIRVLPRAATIEGCKFGMEELVDEHRREELPVGRGPFAAFPLDLSSVDPDFLELAAIGTIVVWYMVIFYSN